MPKKRRRILHQAHPAPGPLELSDKTAVPSVSGLSNRRKWQFRLAAVIIVPLLLLAGLEFALRLIGYGGPTSFFLKRNFNGRNVYIDNQRFSRRFFPPAVARTPQPCMIDALKPSGTCRIFLFGESAAMGDPEPAFGMGRQIEALLSERYPEAKFEVVNVAVTAISSHVIVPIARECAGLEGDVWVVYMGNNEVVGPYGAGTVFGAQTPPLALIRASICLKGTRLGQLMAGLWRRFSGAGQAPKVWGGMEMFLSQQVRRADGSMARVYGHFERNLRDIVRAGVRSGAKVILSTVPSNLKDCAPFASLHRDGLTEVELAQWQQAYDAGIDLESKGDYDGALSRFEAAFQLDSQYADLAYRMGRCCFELGRHEAGRGYYVRARDEDVLRFRADSEINRIIREVGQEWSERGVTFVDGEGEIAARSQGGIAGDGLLYEHVHLTFEGNYWMGRLLAERVVELMGYEQGTGQWPSEAQCRQRLGFTEWNRHAVLEVMLKRMNEPPFTQQSDWRQRMQRWEEQFDKLRPHTKPEMLASYADEYRSILAGHTNDWILRASLAKLLEAAGDAEGAVAEWRRVVRAVPHHVQARYFMGGILDKAGRSDEAQQCYAEALRLLPDDPPALQGLGLTLAHQGRIGDAISYYKKALQVNPDFIEGYVNLGVALTKLGQSADAVAQYEEALRRKPSAAAAHINLGKLLAEQGDLAAATGHFSKVVELAPNDPMARFNLGNVLASQGQLDEAAKQYSKALKLNPDFAECHVNFGLALVRQGKQTAALNHYLEGLRLKPDSALAHFNIGKVMASQNRPAEAIEHYSEAIRLKPAFSDAHFSLGVVYAQRRQFEEAIQHFNETLRLNPSHPLAGKYIEQAVSFQKASKPAGG